MSVWLLLALAKKIQVQNRKNPIYSGYLSFLLFLSCIFLVNVIVFVFQTIDSFFQKLHKIFPLGASVIDLYVGAGVIGLSLASSRKCKEEVFVIILKFNFITHMFSILIIVRLVGCVEINKEFKLAFEKTIDQLPSSSYSNISWHLADPPIVGLKLFISISILSI